MILCVDDDEDALAIIQLSLELDPGLEVRCVRSGADAIKAMNEMPEPDLALIDADMPALTGPETAISILMHARQRPLVIVFLTASARQDQVFQYHPTGVAGVIAKPFNPLTLARMVRGYLSPLVET